MADGPLSHPSTLYDPDSFRGVMDAVPHPIFVKDSDTRFVIVNEVMCRLMNRSYEELVGKSDYDFVPKEQADVFRRNDLRVLNTGEPSENEELFSDGHGVLRTIVTRKKRLILPDGTRMLVGCVTDISDFRRAEALIRHHAEHDALTGLPNRRVFKEKIADILAAPAGGDGEYAFLLIDLDRFKPVNDVYGHTSGDAVLCEIAARLQAVVRGGDMVARLGGDEFAIVARTRPGRDPESDAATALAQRIMKIIEEPIVVGDSVVQLSASIGIAQCPIDGADIDTLMRVADLAMYRAKRAGRGTFRFFEEGMDAEIRDQIALENDLRQANARGEIRPYYQPLMSLADERLLGFEILARWHHPRRGVIQPDIFIPICEKLGLISELTFDLLRTACRDAARWPSHLILSLNLSSLQLTDPLLPMRLLTVLNQGGLAPGRLEIEITESALIADLPTARKTLTALQNLGMKIALDDFGMGYSGMYHLRELRVDKIKIDRSFIASMRDNPESAKIVNAILSLTQSLGLPTVAEGIEDAQAMRRMIEGGCEFGQGFYFGEAVPAPEVHAMIARAGLGLLAAG